MSTKLGSTLDPQAIYQEFADAQAVLEAKRHSAIEELLAQRAEIQKHLEALGYNGALPTPAANPAPSVPAPAVSQPKAPKVAKAGKRGKKSPAERYCPYCDTLGHDGRAHRSQKKKKAFTQAELDALYA